MIKVLLVDDSSLALAILQRILAKTPDIAVVGVASNGREALKLLPELQPDVICTDLKMPVMDGLAFTQAVMAEFPLPILVISTAVQSADNGNIFNLLQAGAIEVIAKPRYGLNQEADLDARELVNKIRVLSGVHVIGRRKPAFNAPVPPLAVRLPADSRPLMIGIGASTGGPLALQRILSALPVHFPLPIVCVQHICAGFSAGLVEWLNADCKLKVQLAETGQNPEPGHVYFAPDGRHLAFTAQKVLNCTAAPPYGGHRPSISVTFESLAAQYGKQAAGVLLTGMGRDGVDGLQAIKQQGGTTIAQDEASSIIFGMPKAAMEEQAAGMVLPLSQMAETLIVLAGLTGALRQ